MAESVVGSSSCIPCGSTAVLLGRSERGLTAHATGRRVALLSGERVRKRSAHCGQLSEPECRSCGRRRSRRMRAVNAERTIRQCGSASVRCSASAIYSPTNCYKIRLYCDASKWRLGLVVWAYRPGPTVLGL